MNVTWTDLPSAPVTVGDTEARPIDVGDEPPPEDVLPVEVPAELAAVSKEELSDVLAALTQVANRVFKKDAPRAGALVSDVWMKLCTTRRWNPEKGPLKAWALGALKSELNHLFASKGAKKDTTAADGFHREVRPERVDSTEEMHLDRAEATRREARAVDKLARLKESIAPHPPAPDVLACKERGVDKPADIASELGLPVKQVYVSLDLIKRHLARLGGARVDDDPDDDDEDGT
jgi:DNA-directed RNA polymerase specialized sigma24 family protein